MFAQPLKIQFIKIYNFDKKNRLQKRTKKKPIFRRRISVKNVLQNNTSQRQTSPQNGSKKSCFQGLKLTIL